MRYLRVRNPTVFLLDSRRLDVYGMEWVMSRETDLE